MIRLVGLQIQLVVHNMKIVVRISLLQILQILLPLQIVLILQILLILNIPVRTKVGAICLCPKFPGAENQQCQKHNYL